MVKTWALVAAVRAPVDVSGTAAAGLNGSFLSFHFWSLSSHIPIIPGALSYLWEQSARLLAHNPTRPEHNEEIKHTQKILVGLLGLLQMPLKESVWNESFSW